MEGYQPSTFHYNSFAFLEFGSERSVLSFILGIIKLLEELSGIVLIIKVSCELVWVAWVVGVCSLFCKSHSSQNVMRQVGEVALNT